MASECSQEAVLGFLSERGGRVKHVDLVEYFRSSMRANEPGKKAAAREAFKRYVDSVAVVKVDNGEKYVCLKKKFRGWKSGDALNLNASASVSAAVPSENSENEDAKQEISPSSGCGTTGPGVSESASTSSPEAHGVEMGNQTSSKSRGSIRDQDVGVRTLEDIPESESPLHVPGGSGDVRSIRTVPDGLDKPDQIVPVTGTQKEVYGSDKTSKSDPVGTSDQAPPPGLEESDQKVPQGLRRKPSGRSQRGDQRGDHSDDSDLNTPKGSRKNFLEHMMSSSPQVRRSLALRSSVYLSSRCKDSSSRSDADVAATGSCSSSSVDYENAPVALEPLEHEWMMCASDGEWEDLKRLLDSDPGLVCKKDFVTGFTCLHWAAKLGRAELLALLVGFSTQRGVQVDVNARSSAGYTPLHLAAMHNHMEVVKLLVGAYDADVEARDYSGKKASQYLRPEVEQDVLDIVGASTDADVHSTDGGDAGGWRLSKVLQANLRPLRLLNHSASEDDVSVASESAGLVREKVLRRKSSLRALNSRLSKIRTRTQIVHSTSLSGHFEKEVGESSGSFRSRPKSNLFG